MATATSAATITPQTMSWVVLPNARPIWDVTASWVCSLVPQSPRTNLPSQEPYCSTRGLSSPRRTRSARMTGAASRDERRRAVGSNVARTKAKTRNDATRMTGME